MSETSIPVYAPRDGRLLVEVPIFDAAQVAAAVARAREAQSRWIALPLRRRVALLERFAQCLAQERERLTDTVCAETGKPRAEGYAEVLSAIEAIRFYAAVAPKHLKDRAVSTGWIRGKSAHVYHEPFGVVGAITPWNYPLTLTLDAVLAAMFAGNAVVVKPSEFTPLSTLILPELFESVGIPAGLLQVVTGDASTGAALVSSGVDKLVFTGSSATGRKVMAAAAEHLVPVVLELGGKDPAIVLADADLDRAAQGIVFGAMFNAGQTCISTERVFVEASVHDALVERLEATLAKLRWGRDAEVDVGPLVTGAQRSIVVEQIREALEQGAQARTGGLPQSDTDVVAPTLLTGVTEQMKVMQDETFGPLLPVMPVADEDEAIARANGLEYGLFASVWTRDLERGRRLALRLQAGGVSINDTLTHYAVAALPMGGVGASGFGRRRGLAGLDEMTRTRSVLVHHRGFRREPWWLPYSAAGTRLAEAIVVLRGHGWLRGLREAIAVYRGR